LTTLPDYRRLRGQGCKQMQTARVGVCSRNFDSVADSGKYWGRGMWENNKMVLRTLVYVSQKKQ
jgi:hypothetical protein